MEQQNKIEYLSIMKEEFSNKLIELINSCKLPPFILEMILKDIYNEVKILSAKQLMIDKAEYAKTQNTEVK